MLSLLAPNFAALDTIWHQSQPFVMWPVGSQSLLAHWMDEAVRLNAGKVRIYASDRPAEIRALLEGGAYWSRELEVVPIMEDAAAPADAVRMDRLPQQPESAPIDSPKALLEQWMAMQHWWMTHHDPEAVALDVELQPGGRVGPQTRIHPSATLIAPFWIGARAVVGAGCRVGPNAVVGAESVLDSAVEVRDAVVMPGTYLGRNLSVNGAIAEHGALVHLTRSCRVEIHEKFILSSVAALSGGPSLAEKFAALFAWLALAPIARCWLGQTWRSTEIADDNGAPIVLQTGTRGPLIVRRWPWLKHIFAGRFRWFGIIPRAEEDWDHVPVETVKQLKASERGIFSWADFHGCHDPSAPDEWIHAAYQATQPEKLVRPKSLLQIFQIAWRKPKAT